jgi:hypothetical protein
VFAVFGADEEPGVWEKNGSSWTIDTPEGEVRVNLKEDALIVHRPGVDPWMAPTWVDPKE